MTRLDRSVRGVSVEIAVGICLLAFGVYVILCNGFDWDVFLSFSEVDRRSWVLDHRAPLWSYQFCAGITRIGDPQAFGLSPLFLLVVLFGSFWGSKLAVLASAAAGVYFTTRLLALFAASDDGAPVPRASLLTLATLFVTSNFFLWHLLVGHFTFISCFFGLGIIFYTLEGYLHGLGRKDFSIGALVAWQHYSGGFFHSTAYLLVPFFIAFALFIAATATPWVRFGIALARPHWRRLAGASVFHLCGLALASYKLIAVWQQQRANPRYLGLSDEINDLTQLLSFQLLPTLGPEWLLPLAGHTQWALHEYSAFSLLPIALGLLWRRLPSTQIPVRADPGVTRRRLDPLAAFVVLYGVLCSTLILGHFSRYAPFSLLNASLFQGSVRVAGRFGVGVTLSLAMACALLIRKRARLSRGACGVLLLLSLLNLATFSWMLNLPRAVQLASLPYQAISEMSKLVLVPQNQGTLGRELDVVNTSDMYATLRNGVGVINCYNALQRPWYPEDWAPGAAHELIDARFGSPSPECVEQSFYTQNEIHIAQSCPQRVCLNITLPNDRDPPAGVHYFPPRSRFCRIPRHEVVAAPATESRELR